MPTLEQIYAATTDADIWRVLYVYTSIIADTPELYTYFGIITFWHAYQGCDALVSKSLGHMIFYSNMGLADICMILIGTTLTQLLTQ